MVSGPKGPLELTGEALTALERIKNSVVDATLLTHPVPETQLSLMADASAVATYSDPIYQPDNSTCCIRKRPNHNLCQSPTEFTTTATLTTAYHNPFAPPTTASSIIPATAAVTTTTGQNASGVSPATTLSTLIPPSPPSMCTQSQFVFLAIAYSPHSSV
nr:unnamed protein product [Spirometra erinaceieuropaei]